VLLRDTDQSRSVKAGGLIRFWAWSVVKQGPPTSAPFGLERFPMHAVTVV